MTTLIVGWRRSRTLLRSLDERWQAASPATRIRFQLALLIASVLVAYHYSLSTLLQNLNLDTPLAYVGLVPAISLGVAASLRHPKWEPAIHDRQLDYIIGLPLVVGAVIASDVIPRHIGDLYWVWRLDLLTLPFFVAGAVSLIFGMRVLWRQKFAVGYLLLAWPLPYTEVLINVLNGFTNLTIDATTAVVHIVHVATAQGGGSDLFKVVHAGKPFELSVVSACSGVNGVVGFLLVGSAFAAIVQGPRLRKTLWLVGGMALLWVDNVGRLIFIFWAGHLWGESFALNVLHPVVGLVLFAFGILVMMAMLGPFGLSIAGVAAPANPAPTSRPAISRITPAVAVVVVAAVLLGVMDTSLKQYDIVANASGEPKLASYSMNPATPVGWDAAFSTQYTWAKPYFGSDSTWYRFIYSQASPKAPLQSSVPVTADVIDTTDLGSFSAFGVAACYKFHGYSLRDDSFVDFGGGIRGEALSYTTGRHGDWSLVYWIWPVKSSGATHYERVILYLEDSVATVVKTPYVAGLQKSVVGTLNPKDPRDAQLLAEREFLVEFAHQVIAGQERVAPGTVLPGLEAGLEESQYTVTSQGGTTGADDQLTSVHHITNAQARARAKALGFKLPPKRPPMDRTAPSTTAP